ncbi:hypothetical protein [Winogradskyella sp.]|uniref:hypothetical protein n=1 Tax=Winogradskyella sp. TaxID=1883156 RepID=UPI001B262515|nr:hypothetical protein [Winogradskyella sp.]MBO6880021.1 hypothetical protein [Winogradskyella sp.]
MNDYYVYIHLNPTTNEIFYVGKGKGHRKTAKTSRNEKWVEYVSKLTEPHKVLVLKENLSERDALDLEKKVLKKIDFHYDDLTTNIAESEPEWNDDSGILIKLDFRNIFSESDKKVSCRFQNLTDNEIIKSLLDFPNEIKLSEIQKEFDSIYDFFHDNYDELEEIDDDMFLDIESALDSINDLIDEYKVSDNKNLTEFLKDLERERDLKLNLSLMRHQKECKNKLPKEL